MQNVYLMDVDALIKTLDCLNFTRHKKLELIPFAKNISADQPAYPCRLIKANSVHYVIFIPLVFLIQKENILTGNFIVACRF